MNFDSFGPFYFERERTGHWRKIFWEGVENYWEGLSSGIGCYAFCIDNGKTVRPWYVGQTKARGGFEVEVFAPHKIDHYSYILSPGDEEKAYRRGKPCIIFFPLFTGEWKLSKNRSEGGDYIDWLETTLIGMALAKNPEIANTSKTRFFRNAYVNGIIGPQYQGRPHGGASFAKKAFLAT